MLLAYLDANVTIYYVERAEPHYDSLKKRMVGANGEPLVTCAISDLLLMEVRVKPMRENDYAKLLTFEAYFNIFTRQSIAMNKSVFELATQLRVQHRIKTPDALHLAAAIQARCDQFWTSDDALAKAAESRIEVCHIRNENAANT